MIHPRLLFLLACLSMGCPIAWGAPEVQTRLSTSHIRVSEAVDFEIKIRWLKKEGQFSFALPELKFQNLTFVKQASTLESIMMNGQLWEQKAFTFKLRAVREGQGGIEGFSLPYIDPNTQAGGSLDIMPHGITISAKPIPKMQYFICLLFFITYCYLIN